MTNSNGVDINNQTAPAPENPSQGNMKKVWLAVFLVVILAILGFYMVKKQAGKPNPNPTSVTTNSDEAEVEASEPVLNK
jgi:heme/copper-type cytochrome/quinol oxidase subunit 4